MDNSMVFASGLDFLATKQWFLYLNIKGYPVLGIVWNFLLLLVPYFSVKLLENIRIKDGFKPKVSRVYAFFIFFVWLAFIPNAAYIITDVRHLANACATASFYKVCPGTAWLIPIFFLYSVFGAMIFYHLLRQMKRFLDTVIGVKKSHRMIMSMTPVISLGVMLGLLNRLNSWELFTKPMLIFKASSAYFMDPAYFIDWLAFTLLLIILYIIGGKISKHS